MRKITKAQKYFDDCESRFVDWLRKVVDGFDLRQSRKREMIYKCAAQRKESGRCICRGY